MGVKMKKNVICFADILQYKYTPVYTKKFIRFWTLRALRIRTGRGHHKRWLLLHAEYSDPVP